MKKLLLPLFAFSVFGIATSARSQAIQISDPVQVQKAIMIEVTRTD